MTASSKINNQYWSKQLLHISILYFIVPLRLLAQQEINLNVHQHNVIAYSIDASIKKQTQAMTESANGKKYGHISLKIFEDDSIIFNQDEKISDTVLVKHDTIVIVGYSEKSPQHYLFILSLFKDSCTIKAFSEDNIISYKKALSDTNYSFSFDIPCENESVVLVSKPTYKQKGRIAGFAEFISKGYWIADNGGNKKRVVELKTYFDVDVSFKPKNKI